AGGGEIEFALARALAQSSGGTLRLRPRPGGGAEVVVTLPKSVLAPLARATAATPSLPKMRILVVDDDAVNRQAMRLLLEREGDETRRFLDECGQPSVMKPYDFSDLIGALGKVAGKK